MRWISTTILLLFTAILFACGGYFSGSNPANSNQSNSPANSLSAENNNINANVEDMANANANIQNLPIKRPTPSPKPEALTRTGPDDSVITAENNEQGDLVETRVFKNHDMLAKVERILTASRREGNIRVFLKNGRVYEFSVGRLKNALNESPEEIIKAVGGEAAAAGQQTGNRAQTDSKNGSGAARTANTASTPQKQ